MLAAAASAVCLASCTRPSGSPGHAVNPQVPRMVGYFGSWEIYDRGYTVKQIPADRLTAMDYAFGRVNQQGEAVLGDSWADVEKPFPGDPQDPGALKGNFHQLQLLKQRAPGLQVLISLGGWNGSQWFSDSALTGARRRRLARTTLDLYFRTWPGVFDGVDLDWEYPVDGGLPGSTHRPEDRRDFTLLLQEFRRQLDALGRSTGRRYLLTAAGPAGPEAGRRMELGTVARTVDWINLMTYDFHSAADGRTDFDAPLYPAPGDPFPGAVANTVDATVREYEAAGVPAQKIVVGVPAYGHGYAGVPGTNHGLFQPCSRIPPQGDGGPGVFLYRNLKSRFAADFSRLRDEPADAPWIYNPVTRLWIGYDDPWSVDRKAAYIRQHHLGGMVLWDLSGDDGSLLVAAWQRLR